MAMKLFMGAAPKFPWRKSASVVLAAPIEGTPTPKVVEGLGVVSKSDYRICMLKRHGNSSYMGNAVVFPGGVYDRVDSVVAKEVWGVEEGAVVGKICAAREALEECGAGLFDKDVDVGRDWRRRVHKDGMQYVRLLKEFGVKPRVEDLHLWCRFKTPDVEAAKAKKGGFETEFYITCLDAGSVRRLSHDDAEVTQLLWLTPEECLAAQRHNLIYLPPPQWTIMHELSTAAPPLSAIPSYAASPSRTLIRDHLIKPYLIVPTSGPSPEGTRTMAYPGDHLHPVYPTPTGIRRLHIKKSGMTMECNLPPDTKLSAAGPEPKL